MAWAGREHRQAPAGCPPHSPAAPRPSLPSPRGHSRRCPAPPAPGPRPGPGLGPCPSPAAEPGPARPEGEGGEEEEGEEEEEEEGVRKACEGPLLSLSTWAAPQGC